MAVEYISSETIVQNSSSSGNFSVTIPSDCSNANNGAVLVSIGGLSGTESYTGALLDQLAFSSGQLYFHHITSSQYGSGYGTQSSAFYMLASDANFPGVGSRTLYWRAHNNEAPSEGFQIHVSYWKNVNTTTPIVDHDEVTSSQSDWTSTLTGVSADDMGILVVDKYNATPNVDEPGYGQTALVEQAPYNSDGFGVGYELGESALFAEGTSELIPLAFAFGVAPAGGTGALLKRSPDPRIKPPVGSVLNPDHPLSQGLIGCWLMNEGGGSNIYDCVLNTAATTQLGAIDWIGEDIKLDADRMQINDPRYQPTYVSVEVIVKPSVENSGIYEYIVGNRKSNSNPWNSYAVHRHPGNDDFAFAISTGGSGTQTYVTSTTSWAADVEHHIVGTYDGNYMNIYVDGLVDASPVAKSGVIAYSQLYGLLIGDSGQGSEYYQGLIKLIRIYNRALSADEISQLHAEPYSMVLQPKYWYMVDFGAAAGGTTVPISYGSLTLTGQSLKANEAITIGQDTLALTGADLSVNLLIKIANATISLAGQSLVTIGNVIIPVGNAAITLIGQVLNVAEQIFITPASILLSGLATKANKAISIAAGTFSLVGNALDILSAGAILITKGAISLVGQTFGVTEKIILSVGSITLTGLSINTRKIIEISLATISYVGQALKINEVIKLVKGVISYAGQSIRFPGYETVRRVSSLVYAYIFKRR